MPPDLPVHLAEQGYRTEVFPVSDGQFYWRAWHGGQHVNGGLEGSERVARGTAVHACYLDVTHRLLSRR